MHTDNGFHANRMLKLDQAEADSRKHGSRILLMHMSALSPTTRRTHAERHGKLFTPAQMREWWAQDDNSIGCKCTFAVVIVDDKGDPLVPAILTRAAATFQLMKKRGNGEWTKG